MSNRSNPLGEDSFVNCHPSRSSAHDIISFYQLKKQVSIHMIMHIYPKHGKNDGTQKNIYISSVTDKIDISGSTAWLHHRWLRPCHTLNYHHSFLPYIITSKTTPGLPFSTRHMRGTKTFGQNQSDKPWLNFPYDCVTSVYSNRNRLIDSSWEIPGRFKTRDSNSRITILSLNRKLKYVMSRLRIGLSDS